MAAYKVPEEPDYHGELPMPAGKKQKMAPPRVHIPVDPAWLAKLKLDTNVTLTLSGTVKEKEQSEGTYRERSEICLGLETVSLTGAAKNSKEMAAGDYEDAMEHEM